MPRFAGVPIDAPAPSSKPRFKGVAPDASVRSEADQAAFVNALGALGLGDKFVAPRVTASVEEYAGLDPVIEGVNKWSAETGKTESYVLPDSWPAAVAAREDAERKIARMEAEEAGRKVEEALNPATLADYGRSYAAGGLRLGGDAINMGARAINRFFDAAVADPVAALGGPDVRTRGDESAPNFMHGIAGGIDENISTGFRRELAGNEWGIKRDADGNPVGSGFNPANWSLGDDPTVAGFMGRGAEVLGSLAPIIIASIATGGATAPLAIGGLGAGGAGAKEAEAAIDQMYEDGTLLRESSVYRAMVESGVPEEEARQQVRRAAGDWAGTMSGIVGGLGGAATAKILNPATRLFSGAPRAVRAPALLGTGMGEEMSQEVLEGVVQALGTNIAAGTDIALDEDVPANAIGGLFGGTATGGGAAVNALTEADTAKAYRTLTDHRASMEKRLAAALELNNAGYSVDPSTLAAPGPRRSAREYGADLADVLAGRDPVARFAGVPVEPAAPTPPPVQPAAAPRQGEPAPAVGPTADQDALLDALLAPLAEVAAAAPPAPVEAPAAVQAVPEPEALAEIAASLPPEVVEAAVAALAGDVAPAPPPRAPLAPAPPVETRPTPRQDVPPPDRLAPENAARLQEAHLASGRDVAREQVQRMRDRVAAVVESGVESNGGVSVKLRPAAIKQRREQLARLDADLTLFDEAAAPAIDDDTPAPPLEIRYGKPRIPPGRARPAVAPEAVAAPTEAQHIDEPGQPAEAATPAVVAEAVQESADNTPRTLPQARDYLLGRVDAAMDSAPDTAPPMPAANMAMSRADREAAMDAWRESVGYVTFNVPGDGTFRVLNTKERLTEFRKQVERSTGFKPTVKQSVPKPPPTRLPPAKRAEVMAEAETVPEGEGLEQAAPQVRFDRDNGIGATPDGGNIDYMGYTVMMRPSQFLALASPRSEPIAEGLRDAIASGKPVAPAFLLVNFRGDTPKVSQHEGRSRMMAIQDIQGDAPVPVQIMPTGGDRARHITPEMREAFRNEAVSQKGATLRGNHEADTDAREQTTRGPVRQSFAEGSTPEMRALSQRAGAAEAESRGLKAAVDKVLGKAAVGVVYLRGLDGLPPAQKASAERRQQERGGGKTAGIFDPKSNTVYLFTDAIRSPKDAVWTALHEIAGHRGLRAFLGSRLDAALEIALQNPTVKRLADAIAAERKLDPATQRGRLLAAEEALAELAAAVRIGDYAHIKARYGVDVPDGIRARVKAAVENFVRRLRPLIDRVLGNPGFTDADVRALLENAWQAVGGDVTADAEADILESTEYTPEQQEAMKKAGVGTQVVGGVEATYQAVMDKLRGIADLKGTPDSRRTAIADKFHALKLHQRIGVPAEQSAYIAARMSTGLPSVMESIMLYGAPVVLGGKLDIKDGSKGLVEALEPVRGEINDWLGWMTGRRAQVLMRQGRENNLSQADIDALLALATGREARFTEAAIEYQQIKKAILDVGEAWGTIDPVARAAWDHAEYIPFYREGEDAGITTPRVRPGLEGQDAGIRRLRGGRAPVADPLSNIVQNFTKLMDSALKNHAALMAVDEIGAPVFTRVGMDAKQVTVPLSQVKKHLLDNGVEQTVIDNMPDEALKGVGRMLALTAPTEPDVVRVMRDGKPEFYKVSDPLVLRAMQGLANTGKSTARRMMIYMRHLLTAGATGTPEFVIANTLRDTGSTWLFTDDPSRHLGDAAKGLMQTLVRDKTTQRMMMAGASFIGGHYYDGDPKLVAKHMRRALQAKGLHGKALEDHIKTIAGTPAALFHGWNRILSATETANRRAIYEAGLRAGKSDLQAMFESKDVLDFSMRGDSEFMRFFTDVVPFLNARIQGVYKIGREFQPDKKRNAIIARGAVMAAVSTALALWNLEEHEEEYDKLPEWEKDVYWHIGPGTAYHTRIPKPFELGILFGTVPERIVRRAMGNDQNRESGRAMVRAIMDTLQINPIPQALLPPTEAFFNYSLFTDRPIEGMRDERKRPQDRHEWYTSDTMKAVSQAMADTMPEGWVMSPKKLEHLWRGYTAGVGGYILRMSDWIVRESTDAPKRPAMSMRDWPGVGRFVRGDAPNLSTRSTEEFYELFDTAQGMETAYKSSLAEGDTEDAAEILEDFGWLLGEKVASKRAQGGFVFGHVREMRRVRDRMSDDRKAVEAIAKSTDLTPEQKRDQIHEIQRKRNDDVHQYVETLRERRAGGTGEGQPAPTGLRPASVPEERRAEYVGVGKGGTATTAPAVLKGARNAPKMVMVGDWSGLPEAVRDTFDRGATGVYDPAEKRAYVVMGLPEAEAKFVAYHEIAGHHGLQGALGGDYEAVLNRARQNPTVTKLADAMRDNAYAEAHGQRNRLALTEEALSELAAARRTGDFDRIERTWGVRIPPASRPGVKGMVERVVQLTRRKLADLTGDEPEAYNDEQVYSLIEDAWQYVKRPPNED